MKEKKPKLDDEDEGSNPIDEGSNSMKKFKKKGISTKCSYCIKVNHSQKKYFRNKIGIMFIILEKHKTDVPYFANTSELENPIEEHCHNT